MPSIKKPDKIIRLGDIVTVTNPERFIRCGYPLNIEETIKQYIPESKVIEIAKFLEKEFGIRQYNVDDFLCENNEYWKYIDRIVRAFAFAVMHEKNFGGRERQIFTKKDDYLTTDVFYLVRERKVVKTGTYYPSHFSQDYSGEYDFESGGLDKEKTHVIFALNVWDNQKNDYVWIERKNLEKYISENENN